MKKSLIVLALFLVSVLNLKADSFTVNFDNDVFFGDDGYYTNGARFMYTIDDDPWFLVNGDWWLFNNLFCNTNKVRSWGISLAQHMYTPKDISIPYFQPDDRPYGGWLYVGLTLVARDQDEMDLLELDLGVTGPPSLSEQTQKWVHKQLGCQEPMGWDYQVKTYPGMDLVYEKRYRMRQGNYFDFMPYYGGSFGDVFTCADAGGTLRLGYNLPDDFGIWRMEPTIRACSGLFDNFSIYGFVDGNGRYVWRNIFLDGDLLTGPHTAHKKNVVGETSVGMGMKWGIFGVTYCQNQSTEEFIGQEGGTQYGTINVTFGW